MTREGFERDLHRLKDDVVQMGVRAGQAISRAVEALKTRNMALAEQVVAEDDALDAMHLELEQRCMRLLATQQPMAGDLRTIASVFAITIALERMADHAEGISAPRPCPAREIPPARSPIPSRPITPSASPGPCSAPARSRS